MRTGEGEVDGQKGGLLQYPCLKDRKLNMTSKLQSSLIKPRKTLVGHKAVTLWHSFTMKLAF